MQGEDMKKLFSIILIVILLCTIGAMLSSCNFLLNSLTELAEDTADDAVGEDQFRDWFIESTKKTKHILSAEETEAYLLPGNTKPWGHLRRKGTSEMLRRRALQC